MPIIGPNQSLHETFIVANGEEYNLATFTCRRGSDCQQLLPSEKAQVEAETEMHFLRERNEVSWFHSRQE